MRIWRLIFARQLVHSNIAREILHTVPEVFHIVPEIFHIVPEICHIVPEIFRIVPSQIFAIFRPQERSRRFLRFLRFHFWALEGYGWHVALRGHKLSRKSFEEIQGYRSRLGMENQIWNLPGFWNRGARWFNSRVPPSLCCFFRVAPHSYTKNIDDAFLSSLAGTNLQTCSCCWCFPSHP